MRREIDRIECPELLGEELERHLFVCEDCRARARVSAALRVLAAESPEPFPVREEFLSRVLSARRSDARRNTRRRRFLLAAAALLLFSFFAGEAHRKSAGPGPELQAEAAYASIAGPSEIEGLLPD
jgi:hypothetical protein